MKPSWYWCKDIIKHNNLYCTKLLLYTNIDQTLVNSLHWLLNREIVGLDCHVITTEYRTRVHSIHMYHLFCNALVHVIHSGVSGQCSYTIHTTCTTFILCTIKCYRTYLLSPLYTAFHLSLCERHWSLSHAW